MSPRISALVGARRLVPAAAAIGAVALVPLLLAALLAAGGHDPAAGLEALWNGAFGSRWAVASATLVRATPLVLTGLAVALAFRAGVLNIGAEGQLLAGAAAAAAVALHLPPAAPRAVHLLTPILAGAAAGAAWAWPPAWLRRRHGVLEVISTIMMNFVALNLVGWLVRGPLQEPTRIYPQSPSIPEAARMPIMLGGTRLHWGFALALVLAALLWAILARTAAGFRIRAVGASPTVARSAGLVDVGRTTARTFLASGALAGLAGAIEVAGVTYALYENLSPGYGYTAIAVALLGALHPLGVAASGVFFGALEAGAAAMQRDAGVPSVVVTVVVAAVVLALVAASRLRSRLSERRAPADTPAAAPVAPVPEARA